MRAADLLVLYDYYYWATGKVLTQAERVTPEQWAGPSPLGERSLQALLVHTLNAERQWRHGWAGRERPAPLQAADFPDAASLGACWREEEAAMRAYLAALSDDDARSSAAFGHPLWQVIAHVSYHGMQHRSEAAMLLTHLGHSPGDIDMVFWLEA